MSKNVKSKHKVKKKVRNVKKPVPKKTQKKPKKKRDLTRFPGLNKNLFSKIKQEQFDYDYIDKLNPEEKEWLSKFTEEYLGARLNGEGKKLHKNKRLRKDCFDRNNARNRDIFSIAQATGSLDRPETLTKVIEDGQNSAQIHSFEDNVIDILDKKKSLEE